MALRTVAGLAGLLVLALPAHAVDLERPDVEAFIQTMVRKHDYDRVKLRGILGEARIDDSVVDMISKPAEKTLTWAEYRNIFITRERIDAGAAFWKANRDALERVSADTGVPIQIVVGIIGVESYFGRITGGHRVLDALATLAFDYPPRARYFRGELEQFLLLVREEDMPATAAIGSYAGAMGRPQFMPSSYRAYAVDESGDGKRDIWNDWSDVAGSIANYFIKHGWRTGQEVVTRATLGQTWHDPAPEPANTLDPADTIQSLSDKGVMFATELPVDGEAQLLALEGADGAEYWVAFHNFFVITRYNRSVMYALAVQQLGQEVALEVARAGS